MQLAATFVDHKYTIKITQSFKRLGIPLIVVFKRAAHKRNHNNGVTLCRIKCKRPCSGTHIGSISSTGVYSTVDNKIQGHRKKWTGFETAIT
jgi:hypothetical protein